MADGLCALIRSIHHFDLKVRSRSCVSASMTHEGWAFKRRFPPGAMRGRRALMVLRLTLPAWQTVLSPGLLRPTGAVQPADTG
ncbi:MULTISPECIES: hypothetical protein [Streptomyces]|uniref:hypothetical protein n=1 Tax=Streptomyces TaxID=1883 RepID=UPI00131BD430|nr:MULTISPECIES: hypothetical protein [Streptomyces]MCH0555885.1 hypothetical protein [Streptomyces sp. MUM 16J]